MTGRRGREWRLLSRPVGPSPADSDVSLVEVDVPLPHAGQVLVRNLFSSIDPGLVLRMSDLSALNIPGYAVGEALWGDALGEVVESRHNGLAVGDIVWHRYGLREYVTADATEFQRVDPNRYPLLTHHLCFGLTAYVGTALARIQAGDTVWVSSAAGGIGSIAGQLARLRGAARVIGSTGTSGKVAYLTETLGYDHAFNYRDGLAGQLGDLDCYYDNVGGGPHLEAAIDALRPHGRIVAAGLTEEVTTGAMPGPRNLIALVCKRLTLTGYYTFDHPELVASFEAEFPAWVRSGSVVVAQTVVNGLDQAMRAIRDQLLGRYLGKVILRV
jgi:NADPH-dependent curcumin reductase CurA